MLRDTVSLDPVKMTVLAIPGHFPKGSLEDTYNLLQGQGILE